MSRQNRLPSSVAALVAVGALCAASSVRAQAAPQTISAVDVDGSGDSALVRVRGWKDPTYTVFRLDQPDRVIVDLRNGDVSALAKKGTIPGKGPVISVTLRHIADDKATVARLVIAVKPEAKYDVRNDGNDLVVEIHSAGAPAIVADAAKPRASSPAVAPVAAPIESVATPTPIAAAPAVAASGPDKNVVRVEVDRLPDGGKGGTRLTEIKLATHGGRALLELKADGPVASYQLIELKDPGRVALDLEGFVHTVHPKNTSAGPVTAVRAARREGNVRVVLESNADHFPPFSITRTRNGLLVSVESDHPVAVAEASPAAPVKAEPAKAEPAKVEPVKVVAAKPEAPKATVAVVASAAPANPVGPPQPAPAHIAAVAEPVKAATSRPVQVVSVDVSGQGRMSRVILAMTGDVQYEELPQADGTRMLVLKNARISKELERRLDASALEGPVYSVASYPQGDTVRLLAALRSSETEAVSEVNVIHMKDSYGLEWKFNGVAPRHLLASNTASQSPRLGGLGGFAGEAASYAQTAAPRAVPGEAGTTRPAAFKEYEGKRVDFTAKDLDIVQFLQAISEIGHINIVASDEVTGKVSIRLRNVPWEEALDIVLKTKGFTKQRVSQNIIRVLPTKTYNEELASEAQRRELDVNLAPTRVRLIPVNFAPATEVAHQVQDLLTPKRGTLSIDDRTNVLIIKDTEEVLKRAELLIRNLDTQTPEVLIEARIVEASTSFSHAAGIQWGGNVQAAPGTGNPTGLVFPNVLSIAGAADDPAAPVSGTAAVPNFAVNMPTPVGVGTGGGLGFIFGSAGGAANLNLRLTAAEQTGTIKTVSAPKAVTLDHTAATISQGVSIPFSQVSAAGTSTSFIEARLALSVTPHVTADGSVLMKISVTNNQPNASLTGSNGQPSISRKEATTTVIVKDGDTTVIGGIYTRQTSETTNKVPWLAEIPIIGNIFKQSSTLDDRTEMLIFVSPKIINRQQSLAQSGDLGQ